jgi:hypothetical protein
VIAARKESDMKRPPAPDFLLVGANKAGTTSLIDYLRRHPGIFVSRVKEPCFFSDPSQRARGDGWYESLFAEARPDQVRGEGSTTYARWPYREAPWTLDPRREILARRPDVRLVYIVRHPVDRLFSQYRFRQRFGRTWSFEEAIEATPGFLDCSRYDVQIEKWREVLADPRQLLVCLSEDLDAACPKFFETLLDHLGVERMDLGKTGEIRSNEAGVHHIASRWISPVRRAPVLRRIFDLVPSSLRTAGRGMLVRSPVGRRLEEQIRVDPMLPATRERLLEEFLPAVEAIERETGRSLPHWRR